MIVARPRRLPGFRFEVQAPTPTDILPRMDIPVFVGFAASGPLHVPVAVEDVNQFSAIFGDDALLAWDARRGERVDAYLAPAVRAFFRNGGRRCWIIRVADESTAKTNLFPLPGLVQIQFDSTETLVSTTPALARARSEGSWSDALRVGTSLLSRSRTVVGVNFSPLTVDLEPVSSRDVVEGDLLRLTYRDDGCALMFTATSVKAVELPGSPPGLPGQRVTRVGGHNAIWLKSLPLTGTFAAPMAAQLSIGEPTSPPISVSIDVEAISPGNETVTFAAPASIPELVPGADITIDLGIQQLQFTADQVVSVPTSPLVPLLKVTWDKLLWRLPEPARLVAFDGQSPRDLPFIGQPTMDAGQTIQFDLNIVLADAPVPGSFVRADYGSGEELWLAVQDIRGSDVQGSPLADVVQIAGQGVWLLKTAPAVLPGGLPFAERISFEMVTRRSNADPLRLADLTFAPEHARFWGALPDDKQLFNPDKDRKDEPYAALWHEAEQPRFPLAGSSGMAYFPIAISAITDAMLGPVESALTPLERDGLSVFNARLFLDPGLDGTTLLDLMIEADFLRYQSQTPRALKGIYAALAVEEATLISVPDAVHPGWSPLPQTPAPAPKDVEPLPRPEWWRFLDCETDMEIERTREPRWGNFLNCDIRLIAPPELTATEPDATGTFILSWTTLAEPGATYIVEESASPDFSGAVIVYSGPQDNLVIYGRPQGDYYYHVRVQVGTASSDWSDGKVVQVRASTQWRLNEPNAGTELILLIIQQALLRMCAARGDLFAVLALPDYFREDAAIRHITQLQPLADRIPLLDEARSGPFALPLSYGEAIALSYGAVYHPWLIGREENDPDRLRRTPPDGMACGIIARRTLARGAWIAPANERLSGMIALTPPIGRERWQDIQDAQINLIRQEPYGFVALNADTLSLDPDLRPINVRRLLILLRRLALKLGPAYVFEPYDFAFMRLVQREFEAVMNYMFVRGAFAGKTPATSFKVVTRNTPQDMEQGRFIVELRVAPSLPLTFVTVRLVQSGDRSLVTEER